MSIGARYVQPKILDRSFEKDSSFDSDIVSNKQEETLKEIKKESKILWAPKLSAKSLNLEKILNHVDQTNNLKGHSKDYEVIEHSFVFSLNEGESDMTMTEKQSFADDALNDDILINVNISDIKQTDNEEEGVRTIFQKLENTHIIK